MGVGTIGIAELRPLRHGLLAPPSGRYDGDYAGDLADDTLHVAIRSGDAVLGFATVLREPCPVGESAGNEIQVNGREDAWRIRGLAVATEARRQGTAGRLIDACTDHAASHGAARVWAWARPTSQARFVAAGFVVAEGEGRSFGEIGPHELLIRPVSAAPAAAQPIADS